MEVTETLSDGLKREFQVQVPLALVPDAEAAIAEARAAGPAAALEAEKASEDAV